MMNVETGTAGYSLMRILYMLAIAVATIGWLGFLVWLTALLV